MATPLLTVGVCRQDTVDEKNGITRTGVSKDGFNSTERKCFEGSAEKERQVLSLLKR